MPKDIMTPKQIVTIFENTFIGKMDIRPAKIGLNKEIVHDAGLDSLDCIEVIMELEDKLQIKIPDEETHLIVYSTFQNLLDICVQKLVADKRLSPADASMIKTQYVKILTPPKAQIIKENTKHPQKIVPQSLLDEYAKSLARTQELERQIAQYQK